MSRFEEYEKKTVSLITPIIDANGFELVDVEFVKEGSDYYLRAYIDKPGGIMINDCELVSRALSDLLDEADFVEESYILEISSPGLTRPFKKDKDFERNIGNEVEINLFKPVNHQKSLCGTLLSFDQANIKILDEDDNELLIERKNISLIRQAIEF